MNSDKILIVGPLAPPRGGIATYVGDMVKSNIKNEYSLLHLNTARGHMIKRSISKNLLLFAKNALLLSKIIVLKKPKLVHIHTSSYLAFWEKSIFLIISKLFLKKVVLHIHGAKFDKFYENSNPIKKYIIKFILNLSDNVIVLSMYWKNFFLNILDEDKICVVPNGINYRMYLNTEMTDRTKFSTHLNTLFLGNLVQRKGVYDILSAIPIVLSKHDNVKFLFAGSEEQTGEISTLKEKCNRLGIDNNVAFITNFDDEEKIKLLIEADIYLLPSYAEGLPISLLEAMAVGLPVITTPVGGIPEIIIEGDNGFLVKPGDYIELADKIISLVENPSLRIAFGKKNEEKIMKLYSWDVISQKMCGIYANVLK